MKLRPSGLTFAMEVIQLLAMKFTLPLTRCEFLLKMALKKLPLLSEHQNLQFWHWTLQMEQKIDLRLPMIRTRDSRTSALYSKKSRMRNENVRWSFPRIRIKILKLSLIQTEIFLVLLLLDWQGVKIQHRLLRIVLRQTHVTHGTDTFIKSQLIFKPRPGDSSFRAFLVELGNTRIFQLMAVHLSTQNVSVLQKYQMVMLLHVAKEWKPKKGAVFKVTHVVIGEVLLLGLTWMAPWSGKKI